MPPRTLLILPAFNEAACVGGVVAALRAAVPHADVLVVDDGSTDGTHAAVPADPRVTVLRLPFNLGIGAAMQTGYRFAHRAGYAAAVQVDADGQHPADQVPLLLAALAPPHPTPPPDLVIGSRFLADPAGNYRPPAARRAGIAVIAALLRLLTGVRCSDPTSGFRAAGPRAIAAFAHFYPDDYPEPEVLLLLLHAGFTVAETPIRMSPRTTGQTSIPFHRGLFYVLKVAAALLLDTARRPWPHPPPHTPPTPI